MHGKGCGTPSRVLPVETYRNAAPIPAESPNPSVRATIRGPFDRRQRERDGRPIPEKVRENPPSRVTHLPRSMPQFSRLSRSRPQQNTGTVRGPSPERGFVSGRQHGPEPLELLDLSTDPSARSSDSPELLPVDGVTIRPANAALPGGPFVGAEAVGTAAPVTTHAPVRDHERATDTVYQ
jgi:hypothetical protein